MKPTRDDFREASFAAQSSVRGLKECFDKGGTWEDGRARIVSREQVLVVEDKPRLESARNNRPRLPTGDERHCLHADTIMAL